MFWVSEYLGNLRYFAQELNGVCDIKPRRQPVRSDDTKRVRVSDSISQNILNIANLDVIQSDVWLHSRVHLNNW